MKEISRKNAEKLGKLTLLFQTQEECGELVKAIGKYNRTLGIGQLTEVTEEEALTNLIEELADVSICLEQLIYLMDIEDRVEECKNKAFKKVEKRYESE